MLQLQRCVPKFVEIGQTASGNFGLILQSATNVLAQQVMKASSIRYEKACNYKDKVYKFMLESYRTREPTVCSLKASENDVRDFFKDLTDAGVSSGHSFVAFGEPGIIGVSLNTLTDVNSVKNSPHPQFTPIKDYGQEISSGRYGSRHANELRAFIDAVESGLRRGVDAKDNKIFMINVLCVHATASGTDVPFHLLEISIHEAKSAGCSMVASPVISAPAQRLFSRLGFYCIREVPYFCFRNNRKVVFENITDGSKAGKMMTLKLGN